MHEPAPERAEQAHPVLADADPMPPAAAPDAPDASERRRPAAWLRFSIPGALLLVMALGLLAPAWDCLRSWNHLRDFPLQLDAEEGFILKQALDLHAGVPIYRSIASPPFLVANYAPLFPWALGVAHAALIGGHATFASLALGRWMTQGSAVAVALLIGLIVWIGSRAWGAAALSGMLFFSGWEVGHWGQFVRVDLPSIALTLGGLAVAAGELQAAEPPSRAGRARLVGSALLFVAAGMTRQTTLPAPMAVALALLLARDWRRLAWFSVPGAVAALACLGVAQALTGGQFWLHVVAYNRNRADWHGWALVMRNEIWFFHRWLLVALGLAGGGLWATRRAEAKPSPVAARWVLPLYALLASAWLLGLAKIGSAPNYVLEPLAGWALCLGAAMGRLGRRAEAAGRRMENGGARTSGAARWRARLAFGLPALALATHVLRLSLPVAWLAALHWTSALNVRGAQWMMLARPRSPQAAIVALIDQARQCEGDLYCERPIVNLLVGRPVLFQPFIMSQLAREGAWDPAPMTRMIDTKRFGLMILNEDIASGAPGTEYEHACAPVADAIRRAYRPVGVITLGEAGVYRLWMPRPDGLAPEALTTVPFDPPASLR
jgi:hypothetical protein